MTEGGRTSPEKIASRELPRHFVKLVAFPAILSLGMLGTYLVSHEWTYLAGFFFWGAVSAFLFKRLGRDT